MEQKEMPSAEVSFGDKKVKLTGETWANIVSAIGVVALCVGGYFHHADAKEGRAEFIAVLKESSAATRAAGSMPRRAPRCRRPLTRATRRTDTSSSPNGTSK